MGRRAREWCVTFTLLLANWALCEEGSLQGALNAINRRQLGLPAYPKYEKFYSESGVSRYSAPENDLIFLGPSAAHTLSAGKDKSSLEYLGDMDLSNKQISSAFRERTSVENQVRERQKLNEMLVGQEGKSDVDDMEYSELLRELYKKYGQREPQNVPVDYYGEVYDRNELRKRNNNNNRRYTSTAGLNMVGMKKRNGHDYIPFVDNTESSEGMYLLVPNNPTNQVYANSMAKRFPVTKRSSNYYPIPFTDEMPRQFKRSSASPELANKKDTFPQTDPKVAQDLSSIFDKSLHRKGSINNDSGGIGDKVVSKPKKTEHAAETTTAKSASETKITTLSTAAAQGSEGKESLSENSVVKSDEKQKPILVKKKSIDWSDYFGIDKRKKSDGLDNEWLMERYHKAVALTSKRNPEDAIDTSGLDDGTNKTKSYSSSRATDQKINDMDTKLRNIEYAIVDDALKATRSHSEGGEFDPREVQEMKDRVISQLAAAYSLEKMRRALKEYRESIRKERLAAKEAAAAEALIKGVDSAKSEEKRLSVPRKSADNTDSAISDNNIKCGTGDENCFEQNYRTPDDLLDGANFGYCPKIQRACAEIASILGQYEKILEVACTMHQMCLFCGDNTWFSPVRQCNVLFLNKADYLCNDDPGCREVVRHSTRYLLELNKLLRSEPQLLDTCDLAC